LEPFIRGGRKGQRGPGPENRLFLMNALTVVACLWGRWDDLPDRFDKHQTVKRRYTGSSSAAFLMRCLPLRQTTHLEWLLIDSTSIIAHQQAAEARNLKGGLSPKVPAGHTAA